MQKNTTFKLNAEEIRIAIKRFLDIEEEQKIVSIDDIVFYHNDGSANITDLTAIIEVEETTTIKTK
jgi:hypothetical protein